MVPIIIPIHDNDSSNDVFFDAFEPIAPIVLSLFLLVVVLFVAIPRAKKEQKIANKYLFEVTIDDKVYILDKKKNKLEHFVIRGTERITFILDDGTYVTSSSFKIRTIPKNGD